MRKKIENEAKTNKLCLSGLTQKSNWVKAVGMKGDFCCDSCDESKRHTSEKLENVFSKFADGEH